MPITIDEARSAVKQLSPQDQQVLAYEILDGLEGDDLENDAEFMAEISRRSDEVHRGVAILIDGDEALRQIREAARRGQP